MTHRMGVVEQEVPITSPHWDGDVGRGGSGGTYLPLPGIDLTLSQPDTQPG